MKFFVYGKLKSMCSKSRYLPFAKTKEYELHGYKMYLRPEWTVGIVHTGDWKDCLKGEIREVKWAIGPLGWLLLLFLDLNEGTFWNVYKRVKVNDCWTYVYKRPVDGYQQIYNWIG